MTTIQKLFKAYSKSTKTEKQLQKLMKGINDYLIAKNFHEDCGYTWGHFKSITGYVSAYANLSVDKNVEGITLIHKDASKTVYAWEDAEEMMRDFINENMQEVK